MSDDIVESLRSMAFVANGVQGTSAQLVMLSGDIFTEAADLIEAADAMYRDHDAGEDDNYGAFGSYARTRWGG